MIAVGHTMVDGVVQLQNKLYDRRAERHLEIYKMRGTGYLHGQHSFQITDQGLIVYPRTEALLRIPSASPAIGPTLETGLNSWTAWQVVVFRATVQPSLLVPRVSERRRLDCIS